MTTIDQEKRGVKEHHRYSCRVADAHGNYRGTTLIAYCPHCDTILFREGDDELTCQNDDCPFVTNTGVNALIDALCRMDSRHKLGGFAVEEIMARVSDALLEVQR